ncbi:PAS domain S-box protein [bacterium]|nr:PAS domain S-box protein [bacterium]
MMENDIRVLLVEDSISEAKLIVSSLLSAQILFKLKQVAAEDELKEQLKGFNPDIVISNYNVASLNGLKALKIVKEHSPKTPVIILTLPNNEETAIACYRNGASDYIFKNELELLGPAMQRALLKSKFPESYEILNENDKRSIDTFELIDHTISDMLLILDSQGHITFASSSYHRILNNKKIETGYDFFSDVHPGDRGLTLQTFHDVLKGDSDKRIEYRLIIQDDEYKHIESQWNAAVDELGLVRQIILVARIITKRKRAEEALRESVKHFRALLENISDAISLINPYGIVLYTSRSTNRVLGYSANEFVGTNVFDLIHTDDLSTVLEQMTVLRKKEGSVQSLQFRIKHKDASWRWMEGVVNNLTHEPSVQAIVFNYRDITERKEAEEAFRENDKRFRALVENSSDALILISGEGIISYVGPSFSHIVGHSQEETLTVNLFQFIHPDDRKQTESLFNELLKRPKHILTIQFRMFHKDGSWRWMEGVANNLLTEPSIGAIVLNFRDITDRKKANEALAEEKGRLLVTLRSIGEGVITTDILGRVMLMNKSAELITQYTQEEAFDKPIRQILPLRSIKSEESIDHPVDKVLKTKRIADAADHVLIMPRNKERHIITDNAAPIQDKDGNLLGVVVVFRDTTDRLKMEEELLKARKIESIGILAGGIAHDFNNILSAILGNISMSKMKLEHGNKEKSLELLIRAEKASERARDLTQQLLTFSKGGAPVRKTSSISDLLRDSANFSSAGSNVRCEFAISPNLWQVDMDGGQMSQVINNLIINARQAMPNGGVVTIEALNIIFDSDNTKYGVLLKKGNYIKIAVRDQGMGIAPENLQKIFDPYFTTKKTGSGLGLATSYSIIKNHEGAITAESISGKGTTFIIVLPASKNIMPVQKVQESRPAPAHGKILIMDDEDIIAEMSETMLTELGYQVRTAKDGKEAIEMYIKHKNAGSPFDVVIMDLTIPGGMGGEEAIKQLIDFDPNVKAIVSSGYSNDPIMANYKNFGFTNVLTKPYQIRELARIIESTFTENSN